MTTTLLCKICSTPVTSDQFAADDTITCEQCWVTDQMQTFLPYADFTKSAQVLDYKRLGKQRVEALQILNAIRGLSKGWRRHPCTIMWQNHEQALIQYAIAICKEWVSRGYKDSLLPRFQAEVTTPNPEMPAWLGFEKLHLSHQSNLVRKDPEFYKFQVPNDFLYVWFNEDGSHYEGLKQTASKSV